MAETRSETRATSTDDELVVQAKQGDPAAFEQLMRRYNQRLFRAARAVIRDDDEAQDAVQEAYLRAFTRLDQYRPGNFRGWLLTIAINEARTRLRRRRPTVSLEPRDLDPHDAPTPVAMAEGERQVARAELRNVLEGAIDRLSDDYREVFVLRQLEQLPVRETAECLGISEGAVKTRLHRAHARLRELLDQRISEGLDDAFSFAGTRCNSIVDAVLQELKRTRAFLH